MNRRPTITLSLIGLLLLCLGTAVGSESTNSNTADNIRTMIRRRLENNPAWQRAQQDPPFSATAPAGFITDESVKAQQRQAAQTLWADLQKAYASGEKSFTIPPGEYRFSKNNGLTISGWTDFSILAYNVCFWFEREPGQLAADPKGLNLLGCRNMHISGLSIDFDPPVYIQATIEHITENADEFIAQIDPDWPRSSVGPGQFSVYTADGVYVPQGTFLHEGAALIQDDRLRIKLNPAVVSDNFNRELLQYTRGRGLVEPGYYIALNFRRGRSIGLIDCQAITLEDVCVYQSPGMGILEDGGPGGHTYRRMRLIRRPGTRRVHYGTADHLHSNRMARGPQVIACEFSHSSDDNINLHGNWSYVWRQLDPQTVIIGTPEPLKAGGELTFYDRVELTPQGKAVIVTVTPLQDEQLLSAIEQSEPPQTRIAHRRRDQLYVVTLDEPVAAREHSLVDPHMNHADGFLIRDCYFHDSRSRGALLSGACNGTVENNIWSNVLSGIDIYEESWGYKEGAIPDSIVIRHNLIINCGSVLPSAGITVGLVPGGRQGLRHTHIIRNIRIEDNLIVNGGILTVLYTDGGLVKNNILVNPMHQMRTMGDFGASRMLYGQHYFPRDRREPLSVWSSRNVQVTGNRLYLSGQPIENTPVDMGDNTETITLNKNKIIPLPGVKGLFDMED